MAKLSGFFAGLFGRKQPPSAVQPAAAAIPLSAAESSDLSVPKRSDPTPPAPVRRLVVGFDFGTSCTKVVIGDPILPRHFLVPAVRAASVETTYLQAGVIYEDNTGVFSLTNSPQAKAHRNLKLKFLASLSVTHLDGEEPINDAALVAVLFLARMFAQARQWFKEMHGHEYGGAAFQWSINIGLPSRDACDGRLKAAYEKAVGAAWELSLKNDFTHEAAKLAWAGPVSSLARRIYAYPEVAAELETFRRSDFGEYGRFLLVDVGAGTVDVSTFAINEGGDDNDRIHFYATEVAHLGAFRWHESRLRRLRDAGLIPAHRTALEEVDYVIPSRISDFGGASESERANLRFQLEQADAEFTRLCADVIIKAVMATHIHLSRTGHRAASSFRREVPTFLCGGGARLELYEHTLAEVGSRLGRYLDWTNAPGLTRRQIAELGNLVAPGLAPSDVDRFAVAYGLSFEHRDLPLIRVGDLKAELKKAEENPSQWRDRVTIQQARRILDNLLYPPIPPDNELKEIRLKRPVTVQRIAKEQMFDGIPLTKIRTLFANKAGCPITDDNEIPDENVVSVLRVNRFRPKFVR
jgi:hypothetical protein